MARPEGWKIVVDIERDADDVLTSPGDPRVLTVTPRCA
jgi:hypothetical protein